MGNRRRSGETVKHKVLKAKMNADNKLFSRSMADRALSVEGADPNEERFTSHSNYHIQRRAFLMSGKALPEDPTERAALCKKLHIKDAANETEEVPVVSEEVAPDAS